VLELKNAENVFLPVATASELLSKKLKKEDQCFKKHFGTSLNQY
jgi:hypothetical protein